MTDTIRSPAAAAAVTAARTLLLCFAVACALAACGRSTVVREAGGPPARVSVAKPGATTVVQRGDTLYGIAFRNGIDVRDLAAWNGIGAPYTIYPGQRLRLYPRSGGTSAASRPPMRPAAGAASVALVAAARLHTQNKPGEPDPNKWARFCVGRSSCGPRVVG